tara:strand:+ start:3563 stop:4996 length:1434 start_codon:yes stop_codon:yes gene_type:complete
MDLFNFFKASLFFVLTKYVVIILNFLRSIIVAASLGPNKLGEYAILVIILEYFYYTNLGIFFSMTKEVSINLDQKDKFKYIKKIINNTVSFQSVNSIFILVLFATFFVFEYLGFFQVEIFDTKYLIYILILGVIYQAKSFIFSYLRLYERINEIVKIEFFSSLFVFLGIYFFVDDFGLDAIFVFSIIGNFLVLVSYIKKISSFKFILELKIIRILIYIGLPLLLFNLLSLMITTIDRIMINQLVSANREALGIYHLGYLLSFGVMTAFNSVIFLLVPKMLKQFYSLKSEHSLMFDQTKFTEFVLASITIIAIITISPFIKFFLTEYNRSILVMQLLLYAYFMKGLAFLPESYLIANNKQLNTLAIFFLSLLNALILNYLSIILGYGIYGVAIATIGTFYIYTAGIFCLYFYFEKITIFKGISRVLVRPTIFIFLSSFLLYENKISWLVIIYLIMYLRDFWFYLEKSLNLFKEFLNTK